MRNLPEGIGLVRIQDRHDQVGLETAFSSAAPGLLLPDDEWRPIVEQLVARADIIVSECTMLGSGVEFELRSCLEQGKGDQTVLIIPPPDSLIAVVDDDSTSRAASGRTSSTRAISSIPSS
jgi:hypothetical protein